MELLAAAGLSAVFAFFLWIAVVAPGLVKSDLTTGGSSAILLGLILVAFGAWVVVDVTRMLRANRLNPRLFWSTYVACLLPLLIAWMIFKNPYGQDIQIIFVVTAAHFIVVSLLISLIYAAKLSVVSRFIIMSSVIIAAYIFAIILSPATPF